MPMVRYEIRNEYALADPELYRSADREDPEALLEGVAMAGLVGVLRQLGDLAEFAAEIFHELHEEVLATAARGHGLILRVQQLEAEFPSVEKALLSQSSHSQFTYNAGAEWHANIRTDQNLITQGDMPRFILDSYEECRGPPRLFMLDKFDIAGAGQCLKRYSDPSFFKTELASSGKVEPEFQREKKARKVKKKVPHGRNDEAAESSLAPHINYVFHPGTPNQVPDKNPTRRVKLKSRDMKGMDTSRIRSCLESLLEVHSSEQEVVLEDSEDLSTRTVNSTVSAPMGHEILIDNSNMYPTSSNRNTLQLPNGQERILIANELENQKINEVCAETLSEPFHVAHNSYPNLQTVDKNEMFINNGMGRKLRYVSTDAKKKVLVFNKASRKKLVSEAENTTEGFADDYRSDDIGSEMENYMDALNTLESEIETDSESRSKADQTLRVLNNTTKGPLTQISEKNPIVESVAPLMLRSMSREEFSNSSDQDTVASLVARDASEQSLVNFHMPSKSEINLDGDHDKASEELHITDEAIHFNLGTHLLYDKYSETATSVIPNTGPEIGDTYDYCATESTSTINPVSSKGMSDKALSHTSASNKTSSCYVKTSLDVSENFDDTLPCINETYEAQPLDGSSYGGRDFHGIIHPEEELISEDMSGAIEMADPNSRKQEEIFDKQDSIERVKHLFDEPEESRKQETETSGGSMQPATSTDPAINSLVLESDKFSAEMESSVKPRQLSVEISPESFIDTLDGHNNSNGLSFEDTSITEIIHPMKSNEALEDVAGNNEIADDLSPTQSGIIFEKVTFECVEDSPVPLTVRLGELKDFIQDNTEACSGESTSPNCPTASPLANQFVQTTVLEAEILSYIAPVEDLPCSVGGEHGDDISNSENVSSKAEVDMMDHLSTEDEPENLHKVESSKETSIAGTKLQSNCEVADGPLNVDDSLRSLSTSKGSDAIENSLQNEPPIECNDPVKVVTIESCADYTESSSRYSPVLPGFSIQLQEDCVPGSEDPDQHELDISEAPIPNSSEVLSSEDALYVSHSSRDSLSVSATSVSCTDFANPDMVDQTDANLLLSKCNSMPSAHIRTDLHLHVDDENKVQEENDRDLSSEAFTPYTHESLKDETPSIQPIVPDDVASRAQTGDEPNGTLAHQEVELLGHSVPFEITESALQDKVDYVEFADKPLYPCQEQSSSIMVNCKNTSELDIPQSNTDIGGSPDPNSSVRSHCSSEHSVDLASNISAVELPINCLVPSERSSEDTQDFLAPNTSGAESPIFEGFLQGISKSNPQKLSEKQISNPVSNFQLQDIEEAQALPPLPPLEWRMGKLAHGSFVSGGNFVQPLAGANPFSISSAVDDKHPHDLRLADRDITQISNRVTPLPLFEERAPVCESEVAQPLKLSELPPIVENDGYQYGDQKQMAHPLNPLSTVSPAESDINLNARAENKGYQYGDQKQVVHPLNTSSLISPTEGDENLNPHDASREGILVVSDTSVSSKSSNDETSHDLQVQGERVQHLEYENPQLNKLLTTVELERSEQSDRGIETGPDQSVRPYLLLSSTEDNKYQYNFDIFRDETVQHLGLYPPLPTGGSIMPHYGFISSREVYPYAPDNRIIPIMDNVMPNGKPSSIRNLPRHPIIDAVAAHDKSKLRKVSEMIQPSTKPPEERNTMLEQIRNKSFSLKPAALTKPNMKGPSTNLKVAAILEKANAIRQACVGSDEDDDEGNWSDS